MEEDISYILGEIGNYNRDNAYLLDIEELFGAIEHLIKAYKELEEENMQIEAIKDEAIRRYNFESIQVSLVKEKIEELKKLITEAQKELGSASKEYTIYVYQKDILQELLEEGK